MEYWSLGVLGSDLPNALFEDGGSRIDDGGAESRSSIFYPRFGNLPAQYSNTPSLQFALLLLLPLEKFQPHPLRPFEETNAASVWQDALFEDLDAGGFYLGDFAVEVIAVDGDMLQAIKLL